MSLLEVNNTLKKWFQINIRWYLSYIFIALFSIVIYSCEEDLEPDNFSEEVNIAPGGKVTYNSADLFWSEFTGSSFDRYEVYYKTVYEKDYKLYEAIKASQHTFTTVYGLQSSTSYLFFIKVISTDGKSFQTEPYKIETYSDVPSKVTLYNISSNTILYNSVNIRWSSYSDESIIDFGKYEIHFSAVSPNFVPSIETFFQTTTSLRDTALEVNVLQEGTTYYFKVRTYNALNNYSESNSQSARTSLKPPDTVTLFEPVEITESSGIFKCTKCKSKYSPRYYLQICEQIGFYNLVSSYSVFKDTVCEINNLKKWTEYFARVQIIDSRGLMSFSNIMDFTTTSGGNPVPVNLYVEGVSRNSIRLEWSEPISKYIPPGPPRGIMPYNILMSLQPNTKPEDMTGFAQIKERSYVFTDLKPGTTYYFRVTFTNVFQKYSYSNEVKVTTLP